MTPKDRMAKRTRDVRRLMDELWQGRAEFGPAAAEIMLDPQRAKTLIKDRVYRIHKKLDD